MGVRAVDLNAATVKEEIVKEALDAAKGAIIDFASPGAPSFTTAPTREGLVYRLKEGATLEAMAADDWRNEGRRWQFLDADTLRHRRLQRLLHHSSHKVIRAAD